MSIPNDLSEAGLGLTVVIPAFNEADTIEFVVLKIVELGINVVVVDDFSTDKTVEKANSAGAFVLKHPINLGQGAALQTGIEFALRNNAEYICTFDADAQHSSDEILTMYQTLKESKVEVALGSRFLKQNQKIPLSKLWILKAAIIFTKLSSGISVTDTHNGFRIIKSTFFTNVFNSLSLVETFDPPTIAAIGCCGALMMRSKFSISSCISRPAADGNFLAIPTIEACFLCEQENVSFT